MDLRTYPRSKNNKLEIKDSELNAELKSGAVAFLNIHLMVDTNMKWYFYVIIGEIIAVGVGISLYIANRLFSTTN